MRRTIVIILILLIASLPVFRIAYAQANKESGSDALIVDLDLSKMSDTIVYAELYQMMAEPSDFDGKIIRISGWYDVYEDPLSGQVYTSCIIPDATGCCAQGLEFVWAGDHVYPQDYPEPGTYLTVTGRFETYMEDEWIYIHLVDSDVIWEETGT